MTSSQTDRHPSAPALHVLAALALELKGDAEVARTTLSQNEAGELAALIARDLAVFSADAAMLQLVTVGAHYDPVEILRPGWPLHRQLDELAARAPKEVPLGGAPKEVPLGGAPKEVPLGGAPKEVPLGDAPGDARGRVIAFGAHDNRFPGGFTPSIDYAGGPLRLVPFVLNGDAEIGARVGAQLESNLLERGMAGADTALAAQAAFGLQVEHARYLTVHDLTAMIAMQYDHAGLSLLWPLLETALLQPDAEEWLDAPPEPLVHYVGGEARIALFSPQAWHARYAAAFPCDSDEARDRLHRRHQHFEARQRQYAAVLAAHAVPVNFVHCDSGSDGRSNLSEPTSPAS